MMAEESRGTPKRCPLCAPYLLFVLVLRGTDCSARLGYFRGPFFRCQDIQERRKKALETFWQRMEDVICLLWPDTLIFPYGSYAVPGMMTPDSDVDVMVSVCAVFMPRLSHFSPSFETRLRFYFVAVP